ncbi:MAG: type II secretion system F family protein [Candidatus Altiarchaeota archaeon]
MIRRFYILLSKVFPKKTVEGMQDMIRCAGLDVEARVWLGNSLLMGTLVLAATVYIGRYGDQMMFNILGVCMFIVYMVAAYNIPFFIAEKRAEAVEEALPSALQLMSSNVRAGMTPYQAMKVSARDEFGVLSEELEKATTKALGTYSFSDALMEIKENISLPVLERSIKLFIRSIESGGHLAKMLEETARDMNENIMLRRQLVSSTKTYTILILLTIIVGMPVLMNVSIHFTERMEQMKSNFNPSNLDEVGLGVLMSEAFSIDFLMNISTVIIVFTSIIASLLIGVIIKGEEKYGLKYAFFIVPATLMVFYGIRQMVKLFFT